MSLQPVIHLDVDLPRKQHPAGVLPAGVRGARDTIAEDRIVGQRLGEDEQSRPAIKVEIERIEAAA